MHKLLYHNEYHGGSCTSATWWHHGACWSRPDAKIKTAFTRDYSFPMRLKLSTPKFRDSSASIAPSNLDHLQIVVCLSALKLVIVADSCRLTHVVHCRWKARLPPAPNKMIPADIRTSPVVAAAIYKAIHQSLARSSTRPLDSSEPA